jgi:hypothetical protein
MDMCRFSGPHDPNFRKVGGEIVESYTSIANLKSLQFDQTAAPKPTRTLAHGERLDLDHVEKGLSPTIASIVVMS